MGKFGLILTLSATALLGFLVSDASATGVICMQLDSSTPSLEFAVDETGREILQDPTTGAIFILARGFTRGSSPLMTATLTILVDVTGLSNVRLVTADLATGEATWTATGIAESNLLSGFTMTCTGKLCPEASGQFHLFFTCNGLTAIHV
jgi:hypothetical protein